MKILEKLSSNVASIKPYEPGKPIEDVARELGLDPNTIIKLASNESALGPSPKAVAALKAAADKVHFYPDGGAHELRHKIAEKNGLQVDNVVVGNGSNEILELVGHCFLNESRSAVFSQYAFIVYKLVSLLFGATMKEIDATAEFGHDLDAMRDAIEDSTSIVFVCTPNNPTGAMLDPKKIEQFMDSMPDDILVVFDLAYAEIAQGPMPDVLKYVHEGRPVLVSRTFSKAYGLAGLRLGYGLGPAPLIRALNQARQPFNCNLMAQLAGAAALDDDEFLARNQQLCADAKQYFEAFCQKNGLEFVPSGGNFVLIKVGDGAGVFRKLQAEGVIVRPMAGYQLPEYIRVTYGDKEQNDRFAEALLKVLGS